MLKYEENEEEQCGLCRPILLIVIAVVLLRADSWDRIEIIRVVFSA